MNSIDQEFVEFVVKSLVSQPDKVQVDRRIDEKGVLLELTVDPEDLGRVIGKRGATAQSLRTLLRALGTKNDARYNLKIIDNGVGGHGDDRSHDHSTPIVTAPADEGATTALTSADDDETATRPIEAPVEAPVEEAPLIEVAPKIDRLSQHRRDLEEFDDLDV
ncbi:MAG: KH domain-containing protein [Candidatus Saccharibacteria bacterium]